MMLGDHGSITRVRAWYDPKTFALVKRVLEFDPIIGMGTVTESYEDWAIDGSIPDTEFRLPPDK